MADTQSTLPRTSFKFKEIDTSQDLVEIKLNDGSKVVAPDANAYLLNTQAHRQYLIQPNTAVTGSFTSNPILFRIAKGQIASKIEMAFFEFAVSETGGANSVTPAIAPYLINRWELGLSDTNAVQIVTADQIYAGLQFYGPAQLQQLCSSNNLNMNYQTFGGESAIPPGGNAFYSVPIPMAYINDINSAALRMDMLSNLYLNANPVVAGSGTLSLVSVNLRVLTNRNDYLDNRILKTLSMYPLIINYANTYPFSTSLLLTAGVSVSVPLSGITCYSNFCTVMVRASKAFAGSAYRTFTALGGPNDNQATIDIIDSGSNSLLGSPNPYASFFRSQMMSYHTPGYMGAVVPFYTIPFGDKPGQFLATGSLNLGWQFFDTTQLIRIQPGPQFVSGTYTLDVLFNGFRGLIQDGGSLSQAQ